MLQKQKLWISAGILCLVLCLQTGMLGLVGEKKAYYGMDEFFSYCFSNGLYALKTTEAWFDKKYFYQMLTADYKDRFNYIDVLYNQAKDVHPPLYYMLLHTVSSFFPGVFSKWFGLSINIIFFVLTQLVLYAIARKFFKDDVFALLPCILYGSSIGCINTVMMIRMYMMLTFFCCCAVYVHILLLHSLEEHPLRTQRYILGATAAVYFSGFLTHYFFLVFGCILSGIFLLYMLRLGKKNDARIYAFVAGGALATGLLVWPVALKHIFLGYRGREAFRNFMTEDLLSRLSRFLELVQQDIYLSLLVPLSLMALTFLLLARLWHRKQRKQGEISRTWQREALPVMMTLCTILLSFIIIGKVAAFITNRYIEYCYPLTIACLCYPIAIVCKKTAAKYIVICCLCAVYTGISYTSYTHRGIGLLYENQKKIYSSLDTAWAPDTLITITQKWEQWPIMDIYGFLCKINRIYMTSEDNIEHLPIDRDRILCSIYRYVTRQDIIPVLEKHYSMHATKVCTTGLMDTWLLEKTGTARSSETVPQQVPPLQ